MNYLNSLKKHKRKIFFVSVFVIIILVLISIIKNINISHIYCTNQYGKCDDNLTKELEKLSGSNYFSTKDNIEQYIANNISIESYNMQYKFPDIIQVNIIELTPSFGLIKTGQNDIALIDKSGRVLSYETETNIPIIEVSSDTPQVGEYVNNEQLFALNFVYDVVSTAKVKKAHISEHSLEFEYEDGIKVIAPLSGDRELLMGTLILIKSQLNSIVQDSNIEVGNKFNEIDLRYKNPVLR